MLRLMCILEWPVIAAVAQFRVLRQSPVALVRALALSLIAYCRLNEALREIVEGNTQMTLERRLNKGI